MGVLEENRDFSVLVGFATGIAVDNKILIGEIDGIENWLVAHPSIRDYLPFSELVDFVARARSQGLDDALGEDICDWCRQYVKHNQDCWDSSDAIRYLHGVLQGISADGIISVAEMEGLRRWLKEYDLYRDCWPFGPARELVEKVLDDGRIDDDEHKEVIEFCRQFSGATNSMVPVEDEIWGGGNPNDSSSIDMICENNPTVQFQDKLFCFTGLAATGQRKVLESAVQTLGGTSIKNVRFALDYLVIGHMSSPMWKYSSYGTKVERVLEDRGYGAKTSFIREADFVRSARKIHPEILPLASEFQD